jgi:hypothetical protein
MPDEDDDGAEEPTPDGAPPPSSDADGEIRDELPADLDVTGLVGPYLFPNNSRRRIPGMLYLGLAAGCLLAWTLASSDAVFVNRGFLFAGIGLGLFGLYHLQAGWDLAVDEGDALVEATRAVGFPVGHASAQLGWRGLRSRPTWRILLYSNEPTPLRRGLVLVDGVDGAIVDQFVEDNPEDWSQYQDA